MLGVVGPVLGGMLACLVLPTVVIKLACTVMGDIVRPIGFGGRGSCHARVTIRHLGSVHSLRITCGGIGSHCSSAVSSLVLFCGRKGVGVALRIKSGSSSLTVTRASGFGGGCHNLGTSGLGRGLCRLCLTNRRGLIFRIMDRVSIGSALFGSHRGFIISSVTLVPFDNKSSIRVRSAVGGISNIGMPLFRTEVPCGDLLGNLSGRLHVGLSTRRRSGKHCGKLRINDMATPGGGTNG